MKMKLPKMSAQLITHIAMLVALEIVLNRFAAINTQYLKIAFNFIPIVVCAIIYGPLWAAVTWSIADIIGAVFLNTVGGAYFPGFTVTLALAGMVYGFFLHRKTVKPWHIIAAVLIYSLILSYLLNTIWISMVYGTPMAVLFVSRLVQLVCNIVFQSIMIPLLLTTIRKVPQLNRLAISIHSAE